MGGFARPPHSALHGDQYDVLEPQEIGPSRPATQEPRGVCQMSKGVGKKRGKISLYFDVGGLIIQLAVITFHAVSNSNVKNGANWSDYPHGEQTMRARRLVYPLRTANFSLTLATTRKMMEKAPQKE
mmetsp:Transcript_126244/g.218695  ORF Transcript_126244/g.218695 Transcript_126244/m.218695 type:complete len:127 (-) Transcript_126244:826-1206(-)